jgi:hypothetical protein
LRERPFDRRAFVEDAENAGLPNDASRRVMWRLAGDRGFANSLTLQLHALVKLRLSSIAI